MANTSEYQQVLQFFFPGQPAVKAVKGMAEKFGCTPRAVWYFRDGFPPYRRMQIKAWSNGALCKDAK
jgi:hypothetical protein